MGDSHFTYNPATGTFTPGSTAYNPQTGAVTPPAGQTADQALKALGIDDVVSGAYADDIAPRLSLLPEDMNAPVDMAGTVINLDPDGVPASGDEISINASL